MAPGQASHSSPLILTLSLRWPEIRAGEGMPSTIFAGKAQRVAKTGLVLFNRFYQPDFDLEGLEVVPNMVLITT